METLTSLGLGNWCCSNDVGQLPHKVVEVDGEVVEIDSNDGDCVGEDGKIDDDEGGDVDCRASNTCTWRVFTIK